MKLDDTGRYRRFAYEIHRHARTGEFRISICNENGKAVVLNHAFSLKEKGKAAFDQARQIAKTMIEEILDQKIR